MKVVSQVPLKCPKSSTGKTIANHLGFNKLSLNRSGQVVIEYVLLLVIVTSLGAVIIRGLVSRSTDEPGLLVAKWHSIIKTIAEDNPEE